MRSETDSVNVGLQDTAKSTQATGIKLERLGANESNSGAIAAMPICKIDRVNSDETVAVVIREAVGSDAAALTRLYAVLTPRSEPNVSGARLDFLAAHPDHALLVAECDGCLIGTAHLFFLLDAMYGQQDFAIVENVAVDPSFQGLGIGRRIMAEAERRSLARGVSKLTLTSGAAREAAHRFYEGCGYQRKVGFVKYRKDLIVQR